MKIETKFDIGEKVWIVETVNGEVCIYSDIVAGFTIEGDSKIPLYYFKFSDCFDLSEDKVIKYEDTESLVIKIKELDDKLFIESQEKRK